MLGWSWDVQSARRPDLAPWPPHPKQGPVVLTSQRDLAWRGRFCRCVSARGLGRKRRKPFVQGWSLQVYTNGARLTTHGRKVGRAEPEGHCCEVGGAPPRLRPCVWTGFPNESLALDFGSGGWQVHVHAKHRGINNSFGVSIVASVKLHYVISSSQTPSRKAPDSMLQTS
jgi:hypothetical protein